MNRRTCTDSRERNGLWVGKGLVDDGNGARPNSGFGGHEGDLANNIVVKNLWYGIIVEGASRLPSGSVSGNTLADNPGKGIVADGPITVSSNKIWGSSIR